MSRARSASTGRTYGRARVLKAWGPAAVDLLRATPAAPLPAAACPPWPEDAIQR